MQFDLTTDDTDETTEAVAPGTCCSCDPTIQCCPANGLTPTYCQLP